MEAEDGPDSAGAGNRDFGMGRGKVFPASSARSLLNPLRRVVQSPSRTVAATALAAEARVLEIGSGPGYFSPYIAGTIRSGFFVALDIQVEMLRINRTRLPEGSLGGLVAGDAMALPFRDATFDSAFVATMLGEVPEPLRAVGEVRRVLRPGGVASFAETRRDSDFLSLSKLTRLVEGSDFKFLNRRGLRWQYVANFAAI